jgi:hypothetical protein
MNEREQRAFIIEKIRKYFAKYLSDKLLTESLASSTDKALRASWAYSHEQIGEHSEIKFTPKSSSTGAEGTMFYDSDDKSIYVAVEE